MQEQVNIDVWGGAGEHGRACYRVQAGEHSVLLDCGGKKEQGGLYPSIVPEQAQALQAVFLSHAHEDHMAALPLLFKHGYAGDIWLTRETHRQLFKYANAWRNYVEKQGKTLPYAYSDWGRLSYRFLDEEAEQGEWLTIKPGLKMCWGPSGHLPGAVWLLLELEDQLVYYSGDYSSESAVLQAALPDQALLTGRKLEAAIVDAAYGAAKSSQQLLVQELLLKLDQVFQRGGHILLPVPLYGRGLDLLLVLNDRLAHIPLAAEASLVKEWERLLQAEDASLWLRTDSMAKIRNALRKVRTVAAAEERQKLVTDEPPHIILTPDAMMLAEPASSYGKLLMDDARHAILFTGHVSADVVMPASMKCEVASYLYKVHQGLPDVQQMLAELKPQQVLLVHANAKATEQLVQELKQLGFGAQSEHYFLPYGQS